MAVSDVGKGRLFAVDYFRGLSTDSKPTNVGNGAEFLEIDTGDIYYFNEAASTWVKGGTTNPKPSDEQVTSAVDAWLDEHPEATTTVEDGSITVAKFASGVIDNTLSVSGAAADAKVTGDRIANIETEAFPSYTGYEQGSISNTTGMPSVNNTISRSGLVQINVLKSITRPKGWQLRIALYSDVTGGNWIKNINLAYSANDAVYTQNTLLTSASNAKSFRMHMQKYEGTTAQTTTHDMRPIAQRSNSLHARNLIEGI